MSNVLGSGGQLRLKLCSVLVAGLAMLFLVSDIFAQELADSLGSNESYIIKVSRTESNMCVYEIVGYLDQDHFLIRPGGSIEFQAVDTDVRVEIGRNKNRGKHYGKPGLRKGQPASFTIPREGATTVQARFSFTERGNNHTRHKVWIFCLDEYENEIRSTDFLTAGGMSSLHKEHPGRNGLKDVDLRGPMMPAVRLSDLIHLRIDPPWRDTGGPEMEVDDP